jgi:hypothetical protein
VRCPRCGELSPEGTAICQNCDEILDASFLGGDEVTPVEGEKTDVGPTPTSPMPARLRKTARGSWNPSTSPPAGPLEPRRPYLAEPVAPPPTVREEARKAADDLASFFRSLTAADRWAAGASAALLVTLALPWRWTRADEEIIGLVAAWPVLFLAAAALAFVYIRSRKADAAQDRMLKLAQLTASGGAAIFTGLFLPWATQSHAVHAVGRSIAIVQSRPEAGAYAGLLCAVTALFAALPALFEK